MNRLTQIQIQFNESKLYLLSKFCLEDIADIYTEVRDTKDFVEADKIKSWLVEKGFNIEIFKWGGIFITNHKGLYAWNYKGINEDSSYFRYTQLS